MVNSAAEELHGSVYVSLYLVHDQCFAHVVTLHSQSLFCACLHMFWFNFCVSEYVSVLVCLVLCTVNKSSLVSCLSSLLII